MTSNQESFEEISQSEIFLQSEGDAWFARNKFTLGDEIEFQDVKSITRNLLPFKDQISEILEIGCGNGAKLRQLCAIFAANGSGIDPSSSAITSGRVESQKFSESIGFNLQVSTAKDIPFEAKKFDVVYFGFCLYLVPRDELLRCISEADRVLRAGGFLVIQDFDPCLRKKNPYTHLPGLFSFKNSYSTFFTGGGHYYLVAKESFSHESNHFVTESDERISIEILYKELDAY